MKTWTLGAVSGVVGLVALSSLGCAGSTDEPEAERQASGRACVNPTTGETAPLVRSGNKIWQDDWLAPVNLGCPVGMEETEVPPPPAAK